MEGLRKELLQDFRSVVSELEISFQDWPDFLPLVLNALRNAPSPQRGYITPITAFMWRETSSPMSIFNRTVGNKPRTVEEDKLERLLSVKKLKACMEELSRVV